MKAWPFVGGAIVLAGAAGVAGVVVSGSDDRDGDDTTTEATEPLELAEIARRDLARTEELDGTVGHGVARPLVLGASGTLTALPSVGDVIAPGDVVAEVDGQPVIVLDGPIPLWRPLGPSVEDGKDVLQLEYILATLGYTEAHGVTIDEDWTSATTTAVEAFQEDHGQEDDGVIDLGEIVFLDAAVRIDGVEGVPGQAAPEAGITVTGTEQSVYVDLDIEDAELLTENHQVEVELPSGEIVPATVTDVGAAETNEADGSTTLPVTLTLSGASDLSDGTPVEIHVELAAAQGVLAVPVEALLALAEGGYGVEVVDGATTRLVGVEIGVFADGFVEVTGDVAEGDSVVVA